MSLGRPWLLLLWVLVPLLVWLRYGRGRRPALLFSDGDALRALPRTWAATAALLLPALYALGLLLAVFALARPRQGLAESRTPAEVIDIVLLVDVSTSMRAEDFSTPARRLNRLDAVKEVAARFIRARSGDRIGLIAFAAIPYTLAPLTLDHAWLLERLEILSPGMVEDGTAIGDALGSAVNRLRESDAATRIVVLLTDGINNTGSMTPQTAAQAAAALGIKVYAIGACSSGPAPVPIDSPFFGRRTVLQPAEIDEDALRFIAEATGAAYFRADDYRTLAEVYREIDRLERTEIEIERFTRYEERFMPFLILALLCLAAEQALCASRLGRVP